MVRVSVLEFAVDAEVAINLARALRLIDAAVLNTQAELVVLPSGLDAGPSRAAADDGEPSLASEDPLAAPFVRALAERAVRHRIHLVFGHEAPRVGAPLERNLLLIGPEGTLLGSVGGAELGARGAHDNAVFATSIGRVGLCLGENFARFESARVAALGGAELLCVSYAAGDLDALDDHPSARALENSVHVLCSAAFFPAGHERAAHARSRIVARDGSVLCASDAHSESVLGATLQRETDADTGDHNRLALRRPDFYRDLAGYGSPRAVSVGPRRLGVAAVGLGSARGALALERAVAAVRALARDGVSLVVLPALVALDDREDSDLSEVARWFSPTMRALAEACAGTPTHVITSVVEAEREGFVHHGVVVGHAGVVARRVPSHLAAEFQWCEPSRRLETITLPWGKLGIVMPDELFVPELGSLWARAGADVLAVVELETEFEGPRVLGRQWAREHGVVVALAAPFGAAVESPVHGVELGLSTSLADYEDISVVVRKVRLGQNERDGVSRPVVAYLRALWAAPRFAPSLVEAVLSSDPDSFAVELEDSTLAEQLTEQADMTDPGMTPVVEPVQVERDLHRADSDSE